MSKGLFISLPAHGHINPTIGLVSELAKKGDEIVYITAEEFRDKFEKVGARFVGYNFEGGSASLNIKEIAKNASDSSDLVNVVKKVMEQAMIKYKIAGSKTIELALRLNEEFDYLVIDDIFTLDISEVISKLKIKKVISTVTMFALNAKLKSNMYSTFLPSIMKNENDTSDTAAKILRGHLLFACEYTYGGNAYQVLVDVRNGTFQINLPNATAGQRQQITLNWFWPYTLHDANNHAIYGSEISEMTGNQEYSDYFYYDGTASVNVDSSFKILNQYYNDADQLIGDKVEAVVLELTAEPASS